MAKQLKNCVTEGCKGAEKPVQAKKGYQYCPFCGQPMSYVCSTCGKPITISPDDEKTTLCPECQAAAAEKRAEQIAKAKETFLQLAPVVLKNGKSAVQGTMKAVNTARTIYAKKTGREPPKKKQKKEKKPKPPKNLELPKLPKLPK